MSASPHLHEVTKKIPSVSHPNPHNTAQDDSPVGTNDTSVVFEEAQNLEKEGVSRNNSNKQKKIRKALEKLGQ